MTRTKRKTTLPVIVILSVLGGRSIISTANATRPWIGGSSIGSTAGGPSFRRRATSRWSLTLRSIRGGSDAPTTGGTPGNVVMDDDEDVVPGNGNNNDSVMSYTGQLEMVKSAVLKKAGVGLEALRRQVLLEGKAVDDFGNKADQLCNQVLEDFALAAPAVTDDDDTSTATAKAVAYDRKVQELEAAVDAPLHVLYLKQLTYLRESALQRYRAATQASGSQADYEAMLQVDAEFVRLAEQATRSASDWDYSTERSFLQAVMNGMAESHRKAAAVQLAAAEKQQTAMQFLQSQQQMIQQLQMQLYGQTSPWNVGVAYRIPDTNFNLQGSYQQGRANLQLSCVPDEYAPLLGPNGFTQGVGPGNLGLSLNLSI